MIAKPLIIIMACILFGFEAAQAQTTEAASYNSESSVSTETCSEGGLDVGSIQNGSWIEFNQINLNSQTSFQARVASAGAGGSIQIRLDSTNGTLIGTCSVPVTGGWQTWTTVNCSLSGASGYHNVYLVFTGSSGFLFNVEWFAFTGSGGNQFSAISKSMAACRAATPSSGWSMTLATRSPR